ncbi:MAG: hypothetical protein ACRDWD_07355 [Acidimicrobiia bacterium]
MPDLVIDVLTLLVFTVVGVRLFEAARSSVERRGPMFEVVRGMKWRHVLGAFPVLVLVIAVAAILIQLPYLSFGWWSALGGEGNPVFGTTSRSLGPLDIIIPVAFGSLLIVGLPLLVSREEWVFRRGAERRTLGDNVGRAIFFGVAHAVIGIPIGAALALSIGGIYLTWCYLHGWKATRTQAGALLDSTRAHLAYNALIVVLIAVALALLAVFPK